MRAVAPFPALLAAAGTSPAFTISLSSADFGVTPQFNGVTEFFITIEVNGPLRPGLHDNPALSRVVYRIGGPLAPGTPSGFSGFLLNRDIAGAEYYSQGSSLSFEILPSANLLDGLQLSELAGSAPLFLFDAREVNTGRYHPLQLQLNADGTGSVRDSNNFGGINPMTGRMVDVDFGEEYISELSFDPDTLTLAVPDPSLSAFLVLGTGALLRRRRS